MCRTFFALHAASSGIIAGIFALVIMSNTSGSGSNQPCDDDQELQALWRIIDEWTSTSNIEKQLLEIWKLMLTFFGVADHEDGNNELNQAGGDSHI